MQLSGEKNHSGETLQEPRATSHRADLGVVLSESVNQVPLQQVGSNADSRSEDDVIDAWYHGPSDR